MEINTIKVDSYPSSEKIYLDGVLYPIKVAMRKIKLTPTVKYKDGERIEIKNDDLVVYDTSGAYTDPNIEIDINKGLPRLREQWVKDRGDVVELEGITSQYGRMRLADKSLDAIRFPTPIDLLKLPKAKKSLRWLMLVLAKSLQKWNMWPFAKT